MMPNGKYGLRVYRFGVVVHGDWRKWVSLWRNELSGLGSVCRGKIRGWSRGSARRLAFVAANADARFGSHLTLTYRARAAEWEDDAERNQRVIRRSKADLHRFLSCLRQEIGRYLWVQEFQS